MAAVVAVLSASGFVGIYSYRNLVRGLSCRAAELPYASQPADRIASRGREAGPHRPTAEDAQCRSD